MMQFKTSYQASANFWYGDYRQKRWSIQVSVNAQESYYKRKTLSSVKFLHLVARSGIWLIQVLDKGQASSQIILALLA